MKAKFKKLYSKKGEWIGCEERRIMSLKEMKKHHSYLYELYCKNYLNKTKQKYEHGS